MRNIILSIFFGLVITKGIAQKDLTKFTIHGSINCNVGIIRLVPVGNETFYPKNKSSYQTKIVDNRFLFEGWLSQSEAFRFRVEKDSNLIYMSDVFIVDSGLQTAVCNLDSIWELPMILNQSMNELLLYNNLFVPIKKSKDKLSIKKDSLLKMYNNMLPNDLSEQLQKENGEIRNKEKKITLDYINNNENSIVCLWKMIDQLESLSDIGFYEIAFSHLSITIQRGHSGKAFYNHLQLLKNTSVGTKFPSLNLYSIKNLATKQKLFNSGRDMGNYTLIDFWFSHCVPCISQFEEIKSIRDLFLSKGFKVIGISIDDENNIHSWKGIISKMQLPWKQYLDMGGKEANKLLIYKYPTNFLLDKHGNIISKDISLADLRGFLQLNL